MHASYFHLCPTNIYAHMHTYMHTYIFHTNVNTFVHVHAFHIHTPFIMYTLSHLVSCVYLGPLYILINMPFRVDEHTSTYVFNHVHDCIHKCIHTNICTLVMAYTCIKTIYASAYIFCMLVDAC